jgi:hypothetical protein
MRAAEAIRACCNASFYSYIISYFAILDIELTGEKAVRLGERRKPCSTEF